MAEKTIIIVCPNCSHRFHPDDSVTAALEQKWEKAAKARWLRESKADQEAAIEKEAGRRAQRMADGQVRKANEERDEAKNRARRLQAQVTALSKKASPDHAQGLGIVRQKTLVDLLREHCITDRFEMVHPGVTGADVVQLVGVGSTTGSILWESKRAINWSNLWVRKLLRDQKTGNHDLAVIVSEVLPKDSDDRQACLVDGVWVCKLEVAGIVGKMLRDGLAEVLKTRGSVARRDDLKGLVYDHVTGVEFIGAVRSLVTVVQHMREQVAVERRTFQRQWAEREQQITTMETDLASMIGGLQGVGATLPTVPEFELEGGQLQLPPAI